MVTASPTNQSILVGTGSAWGLVSVGSDGQQMIVRSDGTVGYVSTVIYASGWGVKGDNADYTTQLQAAIDAAPFPVSGFSDNDWRQANRRYTGLRPRSCTTPRRGRTLHMS